MKKNKILIITLILGILFLTSYLYNSYATSTGVTLGNDENTYDILLNDSTDTVSVPAKSSKTIYYQFSNTNKVTIKYHIGYTSNNVIAKVWWDTEDSVSGTIEYGEYKFIKLKLINESTKDDTITIKPVLGYVNGGDVIPDSNTILITGTINETNTMSIKPEAALTTLGIDKTSVEEISFVKDNIVPSNAIGSTSMNDDGSIRLWYTNSDTSGLYNVYIGSDNGITSFPSDSSYYLANFTMLKKLSLNNIDTSNVTDMNHMLYHLDNLSEIDLSNFNTSKVTKMNSMFHYAGLVKLDLKSFDTSNVFDMNYMFADMTKLVSVDLSNFNTSNVTGMYKMFERCTNIEILDLSSFNTVKNKTFYEMFNHCEKLTNLNISSFNTSSAENLYGMFHDCYSLKSLDLSHFNTLNVTTLHSMFYNCTNLVSVNLSSFNTNKVSDIKTMFYGCNKLKYIDLRNAELSNVTTYDNFFGNTNVPTSATIYLKDTQGNRNFMNNNYPTYTNVQYITS